MRGAAAAKKARASSAGPDQPAQRTTATEPAHRSHRLRGGRRRRRRATLPAERPREGPEPRAPSRWPRSDSGSASVESAATPPSTGTRVLSRGAAPIGDGVNCRAATDRRAGAAWRSCRGCEAGTASAGLSSADRSSPASGHPAPAFGWRASGGRRPAGGRQLRRRHLFARLASDPVAARRLLGSDEQRAAEETADRPRADPRRRRPDAVLRNPFKPDWELPGGIVEPDEPPRRGAVREVPEELGLDLDVGPLLVVDWMPTYLGWDDAIELIFDGGMEEAELAGLSCSRARSAGPAARWPRPLS